MIADRQTIDSAIIKAGCLIDGSGAPARMNVFLSVLEGRIKTICGVKPDSSLPFIDLSDRTLLPLLIDCHVHLFLDSETSGEERQRQMSAGYKTLRPVIHRHVDNHLQCGVTAVRDGGDPGGFTAQYKNGRTRQQTNGFCIRTSGRAWYKKGRYGRIVGGPPLPGRDMLAAIDRETDRVDQIKIINSGLNSLSEFGWQSEPQFTADELAAVVALARNKKKGVMVHANGLLPVREAVAAGVSSIEHGFFMGRENLERMAEKEVFWVPTAVTMRAFSDLGREGGTVAARNLENQLTQIGWARETGVRVALGTDAGSPGVNHGFSVRKEMLLLTKAGYSVEQAVQCATANGAALLELPQAGLLSPGRPADFLAVGSGKEDLLRPGHKLSIFRANLSRR
ncbi:MAG: amidohydrolase family protein [Desulfosudaceae bacterium]